MENLECRKTDARTPDAWLVVLLMGKSEGAAHRG